LTFGFRPQCPYNYTATLKKEVLARRVIHGGRIIGAKIRAEGARKRAAEAIREADREEVEAPHAFKFRVLALRSSPADDGDGQGSAVTLRTVHLTQRRRAEYDR
jgi:hypothetical protein